MLDLPYGAWGSCEDAEALRIMVAAEVIEIAQKKGIPIETNYARDHLDVIKAVPPRNKPSTLQDILAGRKTEVDIFAGAVIRLARNMASPRRITSSCITPSACSRRRTPARLREYNIK